QSFYASSAIAFYSLSLHAALPIYYPPTLRSSFSQRAQGSCYIESPFTLFIIWTPWTKLAPPRMAAATWTASIICSSSQPFSRERSEEHTSELQSRENLVCRLLLEK